MKILKKSILVVLIAFLFSCSNDDGNIDITFLQVNDVYEISPIQGGEFGGMARLETVHQNLLSENENTMLFMAGDFLNPSLLGSMKWNGERIQGKQMIEVMNAMNFDLVAFGNHEFDLKEKVLQTRINESNFPWISGNILNKKNDSVFPFYKQIEDYKEEIKGSYIKEFSDADGTTIKVGFLSVCIPSNPKKYVVYSDMYDAIKRDYLNLKNKVDIVIGLTHVKIEQDRKIAQMLSDIPLIMGGHEHTNHLETVGNVRIAKADANAKSAYIHRINYNKRSKKIKINSELKTIDKSIAENEKISKVVQNWEKIMEAQLTKIVANPYQVIYHAKVPLDGRDTPIRSKQTNLGNVITAAMANIFNDADVAIVNGGSIRIDDELSGDINSVDIFRVLPFGGGVFKVKMKGRLLNEVLLAGRNARGKGPYLQRHNVTVRDDKFLVSNKKIQPEKTYTVVISDYLLKGIDIPILFEKNPDIISVYKPKENEQGYDIRKVVIDYLLEKTKKSAL